MRRRTADDPGPDGGDPDLVVLAVKLFDLPEALATAAPLAGVPRLTVQNGVGAEAMAVEAGAGPVVAGSLTTAVEPVDGGVRRLRTGGLGLAAVRDVDAGWLGELAAAFIAGGLPARVYPDAVAMKWSKLVANLVGNATSAILDLDPAAIYADPASFGVERRQLLEARAVMAGLGAPTRGPPRGRRPAAAVRRPAAGVPRPPGARAGDRRGAGRQVAVAAAPRQGRRRGRPRNRPLPRSAGSTARSRARPRGLDWPRP